MQIDFFVFDLDGTLVNSHETIFKATKHALKEVGIDNNIERTKFLNMIGMHFEDIFSEFGFKVPDFEEFLGIYKSIYFDYIDNSKLYPDVRIVIESVKKEGRKVGLLTTKGQDQAELILKHFGLYELFDGIMGRRPGIKHKPSPEPLLKLCNEVEIRIENTIMIGDSELDVECGKNAGSLTCAVSYGYRNRKLLEDTKPDFLIDNIAQIEHLLNRGN
ncbi:MAG TPA: HAD-IA family hydrolase [Melioribacteraceae bacterium]|nr:HAD-IA family hydrolase [Melioribacteraceae bacterium]